MIFADVKGDMRQHAWSRKELDGSERLVEKLESTLIEKFNELCNIRL